VNTPNDCVIRLDVAIVSYGRSNPHIRELVNEAQSR